MVKHPRSNFAIAALVGRTHRFQRFDGSEYNEQASEWLGVPYSVGSEPEVPERFLLRPEFRSGPEAFLGTYMFVAKPENGTPRLILTALHVLDAVAKYRGIDCSIENKSYRGDELPRAVSGIIIYDALASNWALAELGSTGSMIAMADARTGQPEPYCQRDVAAIAVDASMMLNALPLALTPPSRGEPLWLVAKGDPGGRQRTVDAVVVESTTQSLVFRFAPTRTVPQNTSGAPLINSQVEVVGINVGAGYYSGQHFGHAVHSGNIRRLLCSAGLPLAPNR